MNETLTKAFLNEAFENMICLNENRIKLLEELIEIKKSKDKAGKL